MIFNVITWDLDPEIFSIGNLSIRYYGLMFASAFFFGYLVFKKYLTSKHLTDEMLDKLLIYMAVAIVAGARLGHCFFYQPEYYLDNPLEIFMIWKGGLASHGAAIGILIALWLYVRKFKLSFLWLMDRLVIVVALGGAFIRMGNLFNSEIYGGPTSLPWGFEFVRDTSRFPTVPSHPTQIYEALSYLVIFIILLLFFRKNKMKVRDGFIFGVFMILLFTARFFIEFLKEFQADFLVDWLNRNNEAYSKKEFNNTPDLIKPLFNMGQLLSIPFIIAGVVMIVWTKIKPAYFSQTPVTKRPEPKEKKKK